MFSSEVAVIFATLLRRFLWASGLWLLAWPSLMFFKIGEITGAKAWFWIIGELNYPVVAVAFVLLDGLLERFGLKNWLLFTVTVLLIAAVMPFYYERYGFALGVTLEARYL